MNHWATTHLLGLILDVRHTLTLLFTIAKPRCYDIPIKPVSAALYSKSLLSGALEKSTSPKSRDGISISCVVTTTNLLPSPTTINGNPIPSPQLLLTGTESKATKTGKNYVLPVMTKCPYVNCQEMITYPDSQIEKSLELPITVRITNRPIYRTHVKRSATSLIQVPTLNQSSPNPNSIPATQTTANHNSNTLRHTSKSKVKILHLNARSLKNVKT